MSVPKWWCCNAEFGKQEPDCQNAELPSVRSEPLLAVYSRFKHLDSVFQMVGDSDGSDNTDPFHATTRDLWLAIKESLGISANTCREAR